MSNETIYLKGPFGTGIRYKGRTPFLSMLKLGSACLILGVAGISLYKYKKKIDIDEEIRKDKAVTQNKIDFDNVHTENNRQKKNTRGEIKKDVLLRQTREYSSNCQTESGVSQLSLHSWIEKFHSEYVMPDYSTIPILADVLAASPDGYQDAMMLHLLSAFGGICFSKVRAEFLDKKFHSPSLLTIIEGASGSGKGNFNTVYKVLFHRILESDRNKLKLEGCKQIIQTAGINVSASKFMDILAFNQGVHIYAMETELVKVYEAFSRKGGLEFSYLRNAFDNDEVYQNNNGRSSTKGSFPVYFNCTFTGTPNAVDSLINEKEVEGGTARRFCFSVIPELSADSPTLDLPKGAALENIRDQIDEWRRTYSFYHDPVNGDIPCGEYAVNLDYVNRALKKWTDQQYEQYLEDHIAERNGMRNGIACIAFHCAIVLHMLAGNPDADQRRKRKAVENLSVYIANYCMERYITKFSKSDSNVLQAITDVAVGRQSPVPARREPTKEEIEWWHSRRGTKDEKGKVIGLGTIAKKLGISKDKLSYLFRKYENNQL